MLLSEKSFHVYCAYILTEGQLNGAVYFTSINNFLDGSACHRAWDLKSTCVLV